MKRLLLLLLATPAAAQERHVWVSPPWESYVEIRPTAQPGAVAEVFFDNSITHEGDETFQIERNGIRVTGRIDWNVEEGAERLTITPPEGYYAYPETVVVHEYWTDTIYIYSLEAEMM
jgi:hypothetical protein